MAINVGRRMTDEDTRKLTEAAERFIARHAIKDVDGSPLEIVGCATSDDPRLARLWRRIHTRITGYPDHGYGYVGRAE